MSPDVASAGPALRARGASIGALGRGLADVLRRPGRRAPRSSTESVGLAEPGLYDKWLAPRTGALVGCRAAAWIGLPGFVTAAPRAASTSGRSPTTRSGSWRTRRSRRTATSRSMFRPSWTSRRGGCHRDRRQLRLDRAALARTAVPRPARGTCRGRPRRRRRSRTADRRRSRSAAVRVVLSRRDADGDPGLHDARRPATRPNTSGTSAWTSGSATVIRPVGAAALLGLRQPERRVDRAAAADPGRAPEGLKPPTTSSSSAAACTASRPPTSSRSAACSNVAVARAVYLGSGASGRNTAIIRSNYRTAQGVAFYDESVQALRAAVGRARLQRAVQPARPPDPRAHRARDRRPARPRRDEPARWASTRR